MKKVILQASCFAFIGWGFLSCEKEVKGGSTSGMGAENVLLNDDSKGGNSGYSDKAGGGNPHLNPVDDAFLIEAIHGTNSDYTQLEMLEKLLLDNAPLSEAVLSEVIDADQITDEITELMLVLSTPFQDNIMAELNSKRPAMPLQSIQESRNRPNNQKAIVVFSNPKAIIFGRELNRSSLGLGGCESCSSMIMGSNDAQMIRLIHTDDTPAPIGGGCNSQTQICGLASAVQKEHSRKGRPRYDVVCNMDFPTLLCINN